MFVDSQYSKVLDADDLAARDGDAGSEAQSDKNDNDGVWLLVSTTYCSHIHVDLDAIFSMENWPAVSDAARGGLDSIR